MAMLVMIMITSTKDEYDEIITRKKKMITIGNAKNMKPTTTQIT